MAVCTLGHVELLVPDLAETYDYYHDVLGLEEECREGDSVYLRGWGDFNKFSLTLTEAEESGVGHIAFRVEEPADLERYAERVEDSGYDVEWREAGAEPGHGESIRFTGPAEQPFELFYDIETPDVPKEQRSRLKNQPQKYVDRGVGARRIDHVNCYVPDVTACSEWFQDVLDFGFERVEGLFVDASLVERVHNLAGAAPEGRAQFAHVGLGAILEFAPIVAGSDEFDFAGVQAVSQQVAVTLDGLDASLVGGRDNGPRDGPAQFPFGLLPGVRAGLLDGPQEGNVGF